MKRYVCMFVVMIALNACATRPNKIEAENISAD